MEDTTFLQQVIELITPLLLSMALAILGYIGKTLAPEAQRWLIQKHGSDEFDSLAKMALAAVHAAQQMKSLPDGEGMFMYASNRVRIQAEARGIKLTPELSTMHIEAAVRQLKQTEEKIAPTVTVDPNVKIMDELNAGRLDLERQRKAMKAERDAQEVQRRELAAAISALGLAAPSNNRPPAKPHQEMG